MHSCEIVQSAGAVLGSSLTVHHRGNCGALRDALAQFEHLCKAAVCFYMSLCSGSHEQAGCHFIVTGNAVAISDQACQFERRIRMAVCTSTLEQLNTLYEIATLQLAGKQILGIGVILVCRALQYTGTSAHHQPLAHHH